MERLLNDGWFFVKRACGEAPGEDAPWTPVDLPHDFLIAQADDLYESCDGWYRRALPLPQGPGDRVWLLRFDGVYMDCDVLLNGALVKTHRYGYTAFDVDLTDGLRAGENELRVLVRHRSPNSRWYSGAGLFRDVTLLALPPRRIAQDGVYVSAAQEEDAWRLRVETELCGPQDGAPLCHRLLDAQGACVAEATLPAQGERAVCELRVASPQLWSCETPNRYTLLTTLGEQRLRQTVGFRRFALTPDRGLLVNGRRVKLHGACLHHDLGALGAAFHEKAARRQLKALKAMGVNALRTAHNPPARQVLELCDEMGLLVIDEAFDMWRRAKTDYDYARFFDACAAEDVAAWVRRDRNHPCVLMWSIGNEIVDTHLGEQGEETARFLCEQVRLHDPLSNAYTTIGSNYMPWAGAQRCAELVDAVGYNYGEKLYAQHHAEHPDWVIYGSETASAVSSRGVYRFPARACILSDEDLQCSSLGNSLTSWGTKDLAKMIVDDLAAPYTLGQFLWAGIDYIGEPTPYHTRSSYFGMLDTACFPKDLYYLFKSLWMDEAMIHIGVSWDFNPGQSIDVPVMTNAPEAELLLNGASLGRKRVRRGSAADCWPHWRVPFAPGELTALALDAQGNVVAADRRRTPGDGARIALSAEDERLTADGEDMTFVTVSMVDADGNPVENAADRVRVTVTGAGRLLGLDNGDSADPEGYKTNTRRLFSGKLLAIVGALDAPGTARICVTSPGKPEAVLELPVLPGRKREGIGCVERCGDAPKILEHPVRKLELTLEEGSAALDASRREAVFRAIPRPADADAQEIAFRVTGETGVDSPCAEAIPLGDGRVRVHALGDGLCYLRAACNNGAPHPRVISQIELTVSGLGRARLDPYGFVSAGLYDLSEGEIGAGNEQGVAFARDGYSMVGFRDVDFGRAGSDEITLPIFALTDDPYDIAVYEGDPREGGEKLCVLTYQKKSRWNVYQPQTWRLPRRLTGLVTLCFSMTAKAHLKGFSFARQSRAWQRLTALSADAIYGDSFTRTQAGVEGIGNNVSLAFSDMDFGGARRVCLTLEGATELPVQIVTVRFAGAEGRETTALAEFARGRGAQAFEMDVPPDACAVTFVFLPGSRFDFYAFRFERL